MAKTPLSHIKKTPPEPQPSRRMPEFLPSSEAERHELDASIETLRHMRTMSQRITYAQDIAPEYLDKLRRYAPETLASVVRGLQRRGARVEKAARLLYRITEGDMSPTGKPDYTLLNEKVALWWKAYPADYKDYLKKTTPMDRVRFDEAEIDLFISMVHITAGDVSELVGIQNALVCAHDYIRAFQEAGLEPPKGIRQVYRRLEKRRAYLDPDHTKGQHL